MLGAPGTHTTTCTQQWELLPLTLIFSLATLSVCFRLLAEIDEIAGRKTFVSNDDVANLHFTTTMIKETLRFYCPVSILIRETKQEVNFGGYTLPKHLLATVSTANANDVSL